MRIKKSSASHIVADGRERAWWANEPRIRAEVQREFAVLIDEASLWRRWLLAFTMNREVRRRLEHAAPRKALY